MNRAITFTPARPGADIRDLHYVERGSRHRSIHALLQDCGPQRSAARASFLQKAYREVVSRYIGFGKIEHPLPFLRELTRVLDTLSKRLDCRVDDFRGIGVYVLIQDGATFYLLVSRDGTVRLDRGGGYQLLAGSGVKGVSELPVDVASAQKELFSTSTRDYLVLYRIDGRDDGVAADDTDATLEIVMGGLDSDHETVFDALAEPGAADQDDTLALGALANKVVWVRFARAVPVRDPVRDALRAGGRRGGWRPVRGMTVATLALVLVVAGSVWVSERLGKRDGEQASATEEVADEASDVQDKSSRLQQRENTAREVEGTIGGQGEVGDGVDVASVAPKEETRPSQFTSPHMAVAWHKTYKQPVTTTPVIDGDRVIFGARDGHVYALDRTSGAPLWQYVASDGVGASPVLAPGCVVAADYRGTVFCLDKETGTARWTRSLGAKVVSTPCVSEGEVLVGCTDGVAYALSLETGRVLWKVKTGARIRASATAGDGRFYVPSYDGKLYALAGGKVKWTHELGGQVNSTPAFDGGGVVVGCESGLVAVDAETGERRWRFATPAPVHSFILMEAGRVYAGCNDGKVHCVDAASGKAIWEYRTGEIVLSRPRLEGELLFVTSYDGSVYCLESGTGKFLDRLVTSGAIYSSPIVDGDHVFFGNNQGEFYCINYRSQGSR